MDHGTVSRELDNGPVLPQNCGLCIDVASSTEFKYENGECHEYEITECTLEDPDGALDIDRQESNVGVVDTFLNCCVTTSADIRSELRNDECR